MRWRAKGPKHKGSICAVICCTGVSMRLLSSSTNLQGDPLLQVYPLPCSYRVQASGKTVPRRSMMICSKAMAPGAQTL